MTKYIQNDDGEIREYRVDDFEALRDLVENEMQGIERFVFRGQSDSQWRLETTLDRLIRNARSTGSKQGSLDSFVEKHLNRFKLEIRGRRGDNPSKLEEDELWALGQHYGLATPLLDWSQSPYISIFFALVDIVDPVRQRALWCLNQEALDKVNLALSDERKLRLIFPDSDDNKRLLGQSGLFSKGPVMMDVERWVRENAASPIVSDAILLKVDFPGDPVFRKSALKKLSLMNITHSTIFPDVSGASQHCNIVAEDYEI
ncbi:MAG: FRG domain-containing protein [Pseudomonadota bacterium]